MGVLAAMMLVVLVERSFAVKCVGRRCVCTDDRSIVSCTDKGMVKVPTMENSVRNNVQVLVLTQNMFTSVDVATLREMPSLRVVDLRGQDTDQCLRVIGCPWRGLDILSDCFVADCMSSTAQSVTTETVDNRQTTTSSMNSTRSVRRPPVQLKTATTAATTTTATTDERDSTTVTTATTEGPSTRDNSQHLTQAVPGVARSTTSQFLAWYYVLVIVLVVCLLLALTVLLCLCRRKLAKC